MDVKAAIQEQVAIAEAALIKARDLADMFGVSFEYERPDSDCTMRESYNPRRMSPRRALELLGSDVEMDIGVRKRLTEVLTNAHPSGYDWFSSTADCP